mgnify:CR=1 FL=1
MGDVSEAYRISTPIILAYLSTEFNYMPDKLILNLPGFQWKNLRNGWGKSDAICSELSYF